MKNFLSRLNVLCSDNFFLVVGLPNILFLVYTVSYNNDPTLFYFGLVWVFFSHLMMIDIFYHRFLSHRAFKFRSKILERILLWMTPLTGQGSPLLWPSLHRFHHKYSDTESDIHSPKDYGLLSHILMKFNVGSNVYKYSGDLLKDPTIRHLHKYYWVYHFSAYPVTLYFGIHAYFVSLLCLTMITNNVFSSYVAHLPSFPTNYRNYDTKDQSYNSLLVNYLTLGMNGLHNNHHQDSSSDYIAVGPGEFDLCGLVIKILRDTPDDVNSIDG